RWDLRYTRTTLVTSAAAVATIATSSSIVPSRSRIAPIHSGPWHGAGEETRTSVEVMLADGNVHLLARFGDSFTQPLMLGFKLAGIHAQDFAEKGAVARVVLARQLFERRLDLVGQVKEELRLAFDLGEGSLKLGGGDFSFEGGRKFVLENLGGVVA